MKFIVDKMPCPKDCPFSEWKPYPPCFEESGRYVCKHDHKMCNQAETECRWMIQKSEPPKEE